jgi:hypothetical protein
MNAAVRLIASPFAALARWFKRRKVLGRIRVCDSELEWLRRLRQRDEARAAALRAYRDELRINLIDLED